MSVSNSYAETPGDAAQLRDDRSAPPVERQRASEVTTVLVWVALSAVIFLAGLLSEVIGVVW